MGNIYNDFRDELGFICATNQYIELALRKFKKDYRSQIEQDLIALAREEGLHVSVLPKDYGNRIAQGYITSDYASLDRFLTAFRQLPGSAFNMANKKRDGESVLEWAWRVVGNSAPDEVKTAYLVCDYYRMVRNRIVHDGNDDNKLRQRFSSVISLRTEKVQAPNEKEYLSFDDHVLFSRSAYTFTKYIYYSTEYNIEEILKVRADELYHYIESIPGLDAKRYKKKLEKYLRSWYPEIEIQDYSTAWKVIMDNRNND